MNFSKNKLRKLLEADSRTGKEIALKGKFSPASLSTWVNHDVVPSADQLAALSLVFGVPINYFFDGEGAFPQLTDDQIPHRAKPEIKTDDLSKLRRQVVILKGAIQQIELTLERLENER